MRRRYARKTVCRKLESEPAYSEEKGLAKRIDDVRDVRNDCICMCFGDTTFLHKKRIAKGLRPQSAV